MNSISNKGFAERIFVPVGTMDREAVAGMDGHLADLEVFGTRSPVRAHRTGGRAAHFTAQPPRPTQTRTPTGEHLQ